MNDEMRYLCALAAGALHFCQAPAMLIFWRRILRLGPQLERLPPVTRRIVHVLAAAIVVTVLGTGLVVIIGARELVERGPLALALSSFLAAFWGLRAACQVFYTAVWPTSRGGRVAHAMLLSIFSTQACLYLAVAWS